MNIENEPPTHTTVMRTSAAICPCGCCEVRGIIELQRIWWCHDQMEDFDTPPCFDAIDRDERRMLHGQHVECGWRWLSVSSAEVDDE